MKKIKALALFAIAITLLSCSKKSGGGIVTATTLEIVVTEGNSGAFSEGATVELYDNAALTGSPKYTQTADGSGKVRFSVTYLPKYYVIVHNGSAKNYYNGYIPIAIFTSETEIGFSPAQTPTALVGGVKFRDTNHDGVINASDTSDPPSADLIANTNTFFNVAIY